MRSHVESYVRFGASSRLHFGTKRAPVVPVLLEGHTAPTAVVYDAKCKPVKLPHPLWYPAKKAKDGEPQLPDPPKRYALVYFVPGTHDGVDEQSLCALRDMMHASKKGMKDGVEVDVDSPFFPRVLDALTKKTESALVEVYGVSVESPFANRGIVHRGKLPFPIYSDYARTTARTYVGTDNDFALMPGYEVARRVVLLIKPDDTVLHAWISPAPGLQPEWDEIRKMVMAELKAVAKQAIEDAKAAAKA